MRELKFLGAEMEGTNIKNEEPGGASDHHSRSLNLESLSPNREE